MSSRLVDDDFMAACQHSATYLLLYVLDRQDWHRLRKGGKTYRCETLEVDNVGRDIGDNIGIGIVSDHR